MAWIYSYYTREDGQLTKVEVGPFDERSKAENARTMQFMEKGGFFLPTRKVPKDYKPKRRKAPNQPPPLDLLAFPN